LSQKKYPKEKFQKIKGVMKRRIPIQETPVVARVQVKMK
jgi:hypothetical protein